jgi:glyceraldehyde-3-phosphate dehydrogenase/erythrose-4-phosphate dehydrogenase
VSAASTGLTAMQIEKFRSIAEDITFDTHEEFASKVKAIRESMFINSNSQEVTKVITKTEIKESSTTVDAVMAALGKGPLKFVR